MHTTRLASEERRQLLSVLREFDRQAPPELRRQVRRKVEIHAAIRTIGQKSTFIKSVLVNVSKDGVALVLPRHLTSGTKFILSLRFSEGGGWLLLCEVRNCVAQPHRQWRIGAYFLEHIDDPHDIKKPPLDWIL